MKVFNGIPASPGIGIGKILKLSEPLPTSVPFYDLNPSELDNEWKRFLAAVDKASSFYSLSIDPDNPQQAEIFNTYLLMLSDAEFISLIEKDLRTQQCNIDFIVQTKMIEYADKMKSSNIPYLVERAQDILDTFGKVLSFLNQSHTQSVTAGLGTVIAADTLSAPDAVQFFKNKVAAVILRTGGSASHIAILARSYGIPLISGIDIKNDFFEDNADVIVDANAGRVLLNPNQIELDEYKHKINDDINKQKIFSEYTHRKAVSKDGTAFSIFANIGSIEDAQKAIDFGADGIGLFRTEFLFMNDTDDSAVFSEEQQYQTYKKVLEIMGDKPVTIRTLDSGGDKLITPLIKNNVHEDNPLLGNRAVRFCLSNPDIFIIQIRALLRAGLHGNLKIMIPLITGCEQITAVKKIIQKAEVSLESENIPFKKNIPLGIMVETPSAAVTADLLAEESAFFSIGSNDLTQYTLSVDRENTGVSHLFNEFQPAVIRLIQTIITAASSKGINVSLCGEMASKKEGALLLAALGMRDFSVSPSKIPEIKYILYQYSMSAIQEEARKIADFSLIYHV